MRSDEADLKWHACAGRDVGAGIGWLAREADGEQRRVMIVVVVVGCSGGDGWMLMGWGKRE